jgi:hypothetical protein
MMQALETHFVTLPGDQFDTLIRKDQILADGHAAVTANPRLFQRVSVDSTPAPSPSGMPTAPEGEEGEVDSLAARLRQKLAPGG